MLENDETHAEARQDARAECQQESHAGNSPSKTQDKPLPEPTKLVDDSKPPAAVARDMVLSYFSDSLLVYYR